MGLGFIRLGCKKVNPDNYVASYSPFMVRAGALIGFANLLQRYQVQPVTVFERLGLPADYLDRPDQLIPLDTKVALLETAAELCHCEHFGLTLARQQNISMLGVIGLLVQQSATLREALATICTSIGHHVEGLCLRLEEEGDIARYLFSYQLSSASRQSRQHNDNTLVSGYNIISFLINQPLHLRAAYLSGPEATSLKPYTELLHAPIRFECPENGLVFDRRYLDIPVAGANPALRGVIGRLLKQSQRDGFQGRLLWIIDHLLPAGAVTLEQVASRLGMAPRTVQERLHQQGVSFQQLLDQTRVERVCTYMQEGDMSLTEIAELVGYSQLSALTRSFKRVTGLSPAAWRRQHREPQPAA